MADERPASMSVLALFWPQPVLASLTDPLEAARGPAEPPSVERLLEWARSRVETLIGPAGGTSSTASAVWHWFAPMRAERGRALASALLEAPRSTLVEALAGASPEHTPGDAPRALDAPCGAIATGARRLDTRFGTAGRPARNQRAARCRGAGEHRVASAQPAAANGRPRDRVGAVACGGDPRVWPAESVRPSRCNGAPR